MFAIASSRLAVRLWIVAAEPDVVLRQARIRVQRQVAVVEPGQGLIEAAHRCQIGEARLGQPPIPVPALRQTRRDADIRQHPVATAPDAPRYPPKTPDAR